MKFKLFLGAIVSLNLIIFATQTYTIPLNLEKNPKNFTDWCEQKSKLAEETRHTVEVLLEKAESQNCVEANQKLDSLTSLSLDHNQINDIKPLSGLTNLTLLSLNNNQIYDKTCPLKKSICRF